MQKKHNLPPVTRRERAYYLIVAWVAIVGLLLLAIRILTPVTARGAEAALAPSAPLTIRVGRETNLALTCQDLHQSGWEVLTLEYSPAELAEAANANATAALVGSGPPRCW